MENNNVTPSYYAIIPAMVRYDEDLTPNAKLLYGEITCLTSREGYCWAHNKYFAELYNVSSRTITLWIGQLISKGYLKSELVYQEDSCAVDKRKLFVCDSVQIKQYQEKMGGMVKNNRTVKNHHTVKNNQDSNTSNIVNIVNKDITISKVNNVTNIKDLQKLKVKQVKNVTLEDKIQNYTPNPLMRKALFDFLEMYKQKFKSNPTLVSFDALLIQLRDLAKDDANVGLKIVETATRRGYREFFALSDNKDADGNMLKGACYIHGEQKKANPDDIVDVEY
jgi:hypothetical protein